MFDIAYPKKGFQLLNEDDPELSHKPHINYKVDTRVKCDEKVWQFRQTIMVNVKKHLENVYENCGKVAAEEDNHNTKEHRSQFDVL